MLTLAVMQLLKTAHKDPTWEILRNPCQKGVVLARRRHGFPKEGARKLVVFNFFFPEAKTVCLSKL